MKVGDIKVTKGGIQMEVKFFIKNAQQPFILVDPSGQTYRYNRDGTFIGKSFPHDYDLIGNEK